MNTNEITGQIIDAAMKVHSALGPGLLESAYEKCLLFELHSRGLRAIAQLPVVYRDVKIDAGYRINLLVEDEVVVEVKAIEAIHRIHHAQLLSYLRLSNKRAGLLINFHAEHLKDGIVRLANNF